MGSYQEVTKAYHSNMSENIDRFLDGSVPLLESAEDGYWLGKGMYFWDNYGNAQYWQKKVRGREIVTVLLLLEKLLDLTDKNHLDRLNTAFKKLKKQGSRAIDFANLEDEYELGLVINTIYKEVEKFSDFFDVIKCYGLYRDWNEQKIIAGKRVKIHEINRSNFVTSVVKTIYCVKDEKAIYKICYEGE